MQMRLVGGILLVLSAVFGIIGAAEILMADEAVNALGMPDFISDILTTCAIIEIVFAVIALVGGLMAITGKSFGIALVGGIFGLLSLGFWFMGSLFGLIGLIVILIAKDEFNGGGQPPAMAPPGYGMPPPAYGAPPPGYPPQGEAPPPMQPPMGGMPPAEPISEPPVETPPQEPPM